MTLSKIVRTFVSTRANHMSKRTVTMPLHEYEAMKHRNDDASKDLKERLNIISSYWQPKWTNMNAQGYIDPSARVLNVY